MKPKTVTRTPGGLRVKPGRVTKRPMDTMRGRPAPRRPIRPSTQKT